MSSFLFDLRHALRALRKRPGFTAIVVATMAVGIGSNVGIFAYVLLLGAGLLVRSLWGARSGSFGFEPRGLTVATVYVPSDSEDDGRRLYQDVLDRTRALPGVVDASLTRILPLVGFSDSLGAVFPGEDEVSVNLSLVSPRYFSTLQIPLLAGRGFDERDREESPRVTVVNQRAAERFWPGESPVGRFVRLKDGGEEASGTPYEVVGVVADSTYKRPVDPIEPLFYVTFHQRFSRRLTLLIRSTAPVAGPLHEMLRRHYPELAIIDLVPFEEQLRRAVSDEKMNADLAGSFGALGLFLAALGIFAVMSLGGAEGPVDDGSARISPLSAKFCAKWSKIQKEYHP